MAASFRDRELAAKSDTIETRARYAWRDVEGDRRAASPRPNGSRSRSARAESDRNFQRVERFFYVGAAALVLVGTAIVVGSAFWGEPPQKTESVDLMTPQTVAAPTPAGANGVARSEGAKMRASDPPASIVAGPVEPASSTQERVAPTPEVAESAPAAEAPSDSPSSIAGLDLDPAFLNDDIAGRPRRARRGAEEAGVPEAAKSASASEAGSDARTGKCYVRISGRVLAKGGCQISRTAGAVSFQYSGQTLTLSLVKGKSWSATLGGKTIGTVYKSGSCWGSKNAYVCDRGG